MSLTCTLCCGNVKLSIKKAWEIAWINCCAQSAQKLLGLDLFTVSFFEKGSYCNPCNLLLSDIDFMTRTVTAMETRLSIARRKLANLLLDNFHCLNESLEAHPLLQEAATDEANRIQASDVSDADFKPTTLLSTIVDDCSLDFEHIQPKEEILNSGISDEAKNVQESEISVTPVSTSTGELIAYVSNETESSQDSVEVIPEDISINTSVALRCRFPGCSRKFKCASNLDKHGSIHPGWRPYLCPAKGCVNSYKRKDHLDRHFRINHAKKNKVKCNKESISSEPVDHGQDVISNKKKRTREEGSFTCAFPGCHKKFSYITLFYKHQSVHPGWRPFKCSEGDDCDATFQSHHGMIRHIKRAHPKNNISPSRKDNPIEHGNDLHPRRSTRLSTKPRMQVPSDIEDSLDPDYMEEDANTSATDNEIELNLSSVFVLKNVTFVDIIQNSSNAQDQRPGGNEWGQYVENLGKEIERTGEACYSTSAVVGKEVQKSVTNKGKFPSWIEILHNEVQLPEETFDATFRFLFKLNQSEAEKNNLYACKKEGCHRRLVGPTALKKHLEYFHLQELGPFECPFCSEGDRRRFQTSVRLDAHITMVHLGQKVVYHCNSQECGAQFSSKGKLANHKASNHIEAASASKKLKLKSTKAIYCKEPGCNYGTLYSKNMLPHLQKKHGKNSVTSCYHCKTCKIKFPTVAGRRMHWKKVHSTESHKAICHICGKKFTTTYHLHSHLRSVHVEAGEVENTFRCTVCSWVNFTAESNKAHEKKHENRNDLKCVIGCTEEPFKRKEDLELHVKAIHTEVKKCVCKFCGKVFTATRHLNLHLRRKHAEEEDVFRCNVCNWKNFTAEYNDVHEKLHEGRNNWSCVLGCGLEPFELKEGLLNHVQSYHVEGRVLVCEICGVSKRGSRAGVSMKDHMISHTQEKKYKCRFCDKVFRYQHEQRAHEQVSHADRAEVKSDYDCKTCGKKFTVYLNYYRHNRNHHTSRPVPRYQRKKK